MQGHKELEAIPGIIAKVNMGHEPGDLVIDTHGKCYARKCYARPAQKIEFSLDFTEHLDNVAALKITGSTVQALRSHRSEIGCRYRITIRVIRNNDVVFTPYAHNNIRLLTVTPDGHGELWAVGLVIQRGQLYLVEHRMYEFQCYRANNGHLICPVFQQKYSCRSSWSEMLTLIRDMVPAPRTELPPIEEYDTPESAENILDSNEGMIQWFDPFMGMGAVQTRHGIARVTADQIQGNGNLVNPAPDTKCSFSKIVRPEKGSFKLEVKDVYLV